MPVEKISYHRKLLLLGAFLGFFAIIIGAFGAHGLEGSVSKENMNVFETGVKYQVYHALFALLVGSLGFVSARAKTLIFYFLLFGVIFFSGSIYGLATNALTAFDFKTVGLLTPVGGLFLIMAWGLLIINLLKTKTV